MIEWAADVVVVGGGPAGAATATYLARAGVDVMVLDRRAFPRTKPCGDCMSPPAAVVLDELGALSAVLAERPARLAGWRIFGPGGGTFEGRFARAAGDDVRLQTSLALPRERLDAVLLETAKAAGAIVRTGALVTGVTRGADGRTTGLTGRATDGEPFVVRTGFVVGADGLRSIVARRLGLIRRAPVLRKVSCSVRLAGWSGSEAVGELHVGRHATAGIAPITAPDANGRRGVNITVVMPAARARGAGDARALFWRALRTLPGLRSQLAEFERLDTEQRPPVQTSGPFDWPVRSVVAPGAALAGDAAGYFDPFTGQGIYHALAGARMLAACLAECVPEGRDARPASAAPLARYARAHRRMIREAELLQRAIEWIAAHPALMDAAVSRLASTGEVADTLVAAAGDLCPARSLLRPRLVYSLLRRPHRMEP